MKESKSLAKQRNQLKAAHNRWTLAFQTGQFKTWKEFYSNYLGAEWNSEDRPILWPELKQYLQQQKDNLEKSYEAKEQTSGSATSEVKGLAASHIEIHGDSSSLQREDSSIGQAINRQESSSQDDKSILQVIPRSKEAGSKAGEITVVQGKEELTSIRAKDITNNVPEPSSSLKYNKTNYGVFPIPKNHLFLYWFQTKAIRDLLTKIVGIDPANYPDFEAYKEAYLDPLVIKKPVRGVLLLSPTGSGKTYMVAVICRILWELGYHENRTWSHIPYLLVTKATVIEQTGRVLNEVELNPVADVEVINLEMLRSNKGKMWIQATEKIVQGDPVTEYSWKNNLNPCVLFFDESQGAKNVATIRNRGSTQGQIICAYSDIKRNNTLVSISATPFTRVSEAKYYAVSTHKDITLILGKRSPFPEGTKLSNDNWQTYAGIIADPASPFDYNQAAVERLMEDLKEYVVRVTGIKSQFKGRNRVKVVSFRDDESRIRYDQAWLKMQERKAKADALKGVDGAGRQECKFAIITAFTMAAEKEHALTWGQEMFDIVNKEGKAAVCNSKFKGTIIATFKELIKLGVTRDQVSIIWGGGQTQLTEKQKNKELIKKKKAALEAMGMTAEEILADMGLDDVEDRIIEDFPPEWRLGIQSKEDRQREIDNFQSGKTLYCFYTLKAGGVGLSLHQTDELVPKTYGKEARVAAELIMPSELSEELKVIHALVLNKKDKEATELWNKLKPDYSIPDQLHHCLVRILKCRRKESGYVVEEDVPFNPVRPRKTKGTLSYNAIELVQAVGRVPRLTSQSDTEQEIDVYAGTYETEMGAVVSQKLRCLTSVVKAHEDWQDIIMGNNSNERAKIVAKLIASTENQPDDDDGELIDESEEEDSE